jgi:hypothetical protein
MSRVAYLHDIGRTKEDGERPDRRVVQRLAVAGADGVYAGPQPFPWVGKPMILWLRISVSHFDCMVGSRRLISSTSMNFRQCHGVYHVLHDGVLGLFCGGVAQHVFERGSYTRNWRPSACATLLTTWVSPQPSLLMSSNGLPVRTEARTGFSSRFLQLSTPSIVRPTKR